MVDSIKYFWNSLYSPKEGEFYTHGFLTPEQFIKAGDQLTLTGWKWESAAAGKQSKYLTDPKKQFLRAEASSERRISDIMKQKSNEREIEDGWIITEEVSNVSAEKEV